MFIPPIDRNYEVPRNFSMKMSTRRSISWISKSQTQHPTPRDFLSLIELDDGKILTGKPDQFDGKNPWVSG